MILRTEIVVFTEFNEEETARYKAMTGEEQTEALEHSRNMIGESMIELFPEGSRVGVKVEEVLQ